MKEEGAKKIAAPFVFQGRVVDGCAWPVLPLSGGCGWGVAVARDKLGP